MNVSKMTFAEKLEAAVNLASTFNELYNGDYELEKDNYFDLVGIGEYFGRGYIQVDERTLNIISELTDIKPQTISICGKKCFKELIYKDVHIRCVYRGI